MHTFELMLDSISIEIRYDFGHLYFDRCGLCMVDIEKQCEGWVTGQIDPKSGQISKPENGYSVMFNNGQFNFGAVKAFKQGTANIAKEASSIWKIVQANLGLEVFTRLGCRMTYCLPALSIEDAEKRLAKSQLTVTIPDAMNSKYAIRNRIMVVVLSAGETEYRLELKVVTRLEGVQPSSLMMTEPRLLSKRQREIRIIQQKKLEEYNAQPMYAISLDIDCVQLHPENIALEGFVTDQAVVVERDFVPLLRDL
jgi:hypothetical protein